MKKEIGFWRNLWENGKTGIGLFLGSILFIAYSIIVVSYEIGNGWRGHPSVQGVLTDISRSIPVAGASVATLIGGIDLIVFLSRLYADRKNKRFQEAVDAAAAEAREEGYAAGYAARQQDQDSGDNLAE